MKIDTNLMNLTQSLQHPAPANPESAKGPGHHHIAEDGDKIQLSDLASRLSAQATVADPSRLAQLQAAFQAGTYQVPPHQIAASIIHELTSS